MVSITVLFYASIIVGALASFVGFYCIKYAIEEDKAIIKTRAYVLLILSLAFIIHTMGDFFLSYGENIERNLESLAHVMIFFAFLIIIGSSNKIFALAEEYGFT